MILTLWQEGEKMSTLWQAGEKYLHNDRRVK